MEQGAYREPWPQAPDLVARILGPRQDLAYLAALVPLVVFALAFYRGEAALRLGLAAAIGLAASFSWSTALSRASADELLSRFRPLVSPTVAALFTAVLLPPALPLLLCALAVAISIVFDVIAAPAARYFRVHPALVGFAAISFVGQRYFNELRVPFDLSPICDPLRCGTGSEPIDPLRLYIGNVPSLLGAGSVLAAVMAILILYLWERLITDPPGRVLLWPLGGFLVGEFVVASLSRDDIAFQLIQGPALVAAGLLAGEMRLMEDRRSVAMLTGVVGGALAVYLRHHGVGVESAPLGALVTMMLGTPLEQMWQDLRARRLEVRRQSRVIPSRGRGADPGQDPEPELALDPAPEPAAAPPPVAAPAPAPALDPARRPRVPRARPADPGPVPDPDPVPDPAPAAPPRRRTRPDPPPPTRAGGRGRS